MKTRLLKLFTGLALSTLTFASQAQSLYWDANDATPGAGATPAGTWGTDNFWGTSADGDVTTGAWADGNTAVFSAGTDASGTFSVILNGTQTVAGLAFEEGSVTITTNVGTPGQLTLTGPAVDVAGTATLEAMVDGTVGLTKTGNGTVSLLGTNSFTNTVTVSGGILSFSGEVGTTAGALNPLGRYPGVATPGRIVLGAGSTLRSTKQGSDSSGSTFFVATNRGIAISGGVTLEATDTTANRALSYAGIIAGSGGLTKAGGGKSDYEGNQHLYGRDNFFGGRIGGDEPVRFRQSHESIGFSGGAHDCAGDHDFDQSCADGG